MTRTITFELPETLLIALKNTPEEMTSTIRMAAAAKLYELGKLSSGKAAELAGVSRVTFLHQIGGYGVAAFDATPEELHEELEVLRRIQPA